ncbi:hypothetical protein DL89DRAFT_307694 [Linderina pennispora]|uniref:Transmembrane protein n=1 Tax=Linderina pennispora TaxID=61395 RepID=A0A1Y1VR64_9FUNG|nr:uncharacterized protein DL89DRAFT_307694 [Linderina pennispora]ORX63545.1 hypothetical protein DL89DRAFT_307694 [Linderina pennispora]
MRRSCVERTTRVRNGHQTTFHQHTNAMVHDFCKTAIGINLNTPLLSLSHIVKLDLMQGHTIRSRWCYAIVIWALAACAVAAPIHILLPDQITLAEGNIVTFYSSHPAGPHELGSDPRDTPSVLTIDGHMLMRAMDTGGASNAEDSDLPATSTNPAPDREHSGNTPDPQTANPETDSDDDDDDGDEKPSLSTNAGKRAKAGRRIDMSLEDQSLDSAVQGMGDDDESPIDEAERLTSADKSSLDDVIVDAQLWSKGEASPTSTPKSTWNTGDTLDDVVLDPHSPFSTVSTTSLSETSHTRTSSVSIETVNSSPPPGLQTSRQTPLSSIPVLTSIPSSFPSAAPDVPYSSLSTSASTSVASQTSDTSGTTGTSQSSASVSTTLAPSITTVSSVPALIGDILSILSTATGRPASSATSATVAGSTPALTASLVSSTPSPNTSSPSDSPLLAASSSLTKPAKAALLDSSSTQVSQQSSSALLGWFNGLSLSPASTSPSAVSVQSSTAPAMFPVLATPLSTSISPSLFAWLTPGSSASVSAASPTTAMSSTVSSPVPGIFGSFLSASPAASTSSALAASGSKSGGIFSWLSATPPALLASIDINICSTIQHQRNW